MIFSGGGLIIFAASLMNLNVNTVFPLPVGPLMIAVNGCFQLGSMITNDDPTQSFTVYIHIYYFRLINNNNIVHISFAASTTEIYTNQ